MDISILSEAWIKASAEADASSQENDWSVNYVIDLMLEGKFCELWTFVLSTYKKPMTGDALGLLAAGPLEDILAHAGEQYIDEIEVLIRQDPAFRQLPGGVWQNAMSDTIWQRISNASGKGW